MRVGINRLKNYLGEIAAGLAVVAFSGTGFLLVDTGRHLQAFDNHEDQPAHKGQLAQNKATTRAVNEIDTKVEKVKTSLDSTNKKLDEYAEEAGEFRAEQRAVNHDIIKALSRIEGELKQGE